MIPFQPRDSLPQVSAAKGLHRSTARSPCANSPPSAALKKKYNGAAKSETAFAQLSALLFVVAISCRATSLQGMEVQTANTFQEWRQCA